MSLITGGVIGFVGDGDGRLIAGIVNFIFITSAIIFFQTITNLPFSRPIFILNQLGAILAFTTVAVVSTLIGQRLKISWNKWRNAT